jgi:hypothetical protein
MIETKELKTKLEQVIKLIEQVDQDNWRLKEASKLTSELIKQEGILDFLTSPFIQNIINLLAPYLGNYKIQQAIKLLQEGLQELKGK